LKVGHYNAYIMVDKRQAILGMQRIAGALLIGSALGGCGQKGPLSLPSEKSKTQSAPQKPVSPGSAANPAAR
jgi:predicted small lipoprotein YifL